ncbi:MAG: hypothetical protein E4H20_01725 [Spirochaetales bacterium]|nr:MAG: hypothetical protein E4H20_01725 [Spirochaetales bacterium]
MIAPPPVGYPEFERGRTDVQDGGNIVFLSMDTMGSQLYVFGGSYLRDYQFCLTDRAALNVSIGGSALAGSEYSLLMVQAPLHSGAILTAIKTPRLPVRGAGRQPGNIYNDHPDAHDTTICNRRHDNDDDHGFWDGHRRSTGQLVCRYRSRSGGCSGKLKRWNSPLYRWGDLAIINPAFP